LRYRQRFELPFDSCRAHDLADDKIGTYVLADASRRVVDIGARIVAE